MSTAQELLHTHGLNIFKGLAVAGAGGALLSRLLVGSADAEAPPGGAASKKVFGRAGPAFVSLALQESEDVNHNTKRLRFGLPGEGDVSGLPLTSALLTVAVPKGHYLPVLRPYTPISPSDQAGVVEFMVKRYPNGKQSTHLHSLSPGDKVLFAVVIPGYKWTPNKHDSITLIAGGAGITPCYQLIQGILQDPADKTKIRLVFGVNAEEDVLLRREFEDLESRFGKDRFRAVYAVSRGGEKLAGGDERFRKGYVTEALLREVAVPASEENTKVMVCGPPGMEEALLGKKGWGGRQEGILAKLGYRKDQIHQF
ncbi:hypothetical protein M406DRAFT_48989 [Cryphonectria parasitica EP155]|uniref:NADH-cytochrome b5 reductase n=1 Tax=Cryphonectria parasitica (strain ATCC 38755 / EP155) TaxID=660469 RepID=A0A9P4XYG9_CRYP1|nr:uncharacterized protein M406DRAFT_48989 [Cryphonectria parasitica EP155]KAF3763226.1 hypothetical protein M406DRAFT_48989 [Cryphonectria parasitica EP155]